MESLPEIQFGKCRILERDGKVYYVWPLTEKVKTKIRDFLEAPDLAFGFGNTLEEVPPFFCQECGTEITFFDQVRVGVESDVHSRERMVKALQEKVLVGTGAVHHIECEEGHAQPLVMGWARNFGWTYD